MPSGVGAYRHRFRVTHETASSTNLSTRGQQNAVPATFANVRGSLRTLRMDEQVLANQQFARATHEIEMHHLAGLTEQMYFEEDNIRYGIVGIDDVDGRGRKMRLLVREDKST